MIKQLIANLFRPTSSPSGDEAQGATVFRGQNMILRGLAGKPYFECFEGNLDLQEDFDPHDNPLSGLLTFVEGTVLVQGDANTRFWTECHHGQLIEANGEYIAVEKILADDMLICGRPLLKSALTVIGYRMSQLYEVNDRRGVSLTGSVIHTEKGNLVGVGSGTLYIDGAPLNGDSLVLSNRPQAAVYNPKDDTFNVHELGYTTTPTNPVMDPVAGGTSGMVNGNKHSFMYSWWSGAMIKGFSDPSDVVKLDSTTAALQITAALNRFRADFTAALKITTFVDADVDVALNKVHHVAHGYVDGYTAKLYNRGGGALPVGLPFLQNVYIGALGADDYAFYRTSADALADTNRIDITSAAGGGTNSVYILPINAFGIRAWGSLAGKRTTSTTGATVTLTDPNEGNYDKGPWYKLADIGIEDLDATNFFYFDYQDTDVTDLVTGDNDPPEDCEFVCLIENRAAFIGAGGQANSRTGKTQTNPGPTVFLGKAGNLDAAPADWSANLQSNVVGWFQAVGRWFMLTVKALRFVVPTGLLGQSLQGTLGLELPIIDRPYWSTGAANRYSITVVGDDLIGRSGGKFFRSIANGDENVKKYDFGGAVREVTRNWYDAYVYCVEDPKNAQVLFVYTAAGINEDGYFYSIIRPYSLDQEAWLPEVVLSKPDRDQVISGVAVVLNRAEFLCGGRVSGGTWQIKTYRWDTVDPLNPVTAMPYYIVWQPSDEGDSQHTKKITSIQPFGKFTSMRVQIHGSTKGGVFNVFGLEQGLGFRIEKAFPDTADITEYLSEQLLCSRLGTYAVRLGGTWDGNGIPDRLDELNIEVETHGRKR